MEKNLLEDMGMDVRIILKYILYMLNRIRNYKLDSTGSGKALAVRYGEGGNESSSSVKARNFLAR